MECGSNIIAQIQEDSQTQLGSKVCEGPQKEPRPAVPAVEADPELDGPLLDLFSCPIKQLHSYSLKSKDIEDEKVEPPNSSVPEGLNGDIKKEPQPMLQAEISCTDLTQVSCLALIPSPSCDFFLVGSYLKMKNSFILPNQSLNTLIISIWLTN